MFARLLVSFFTLYAGLSSGTERLPRPDRRLVVYLKAGIQNTDAPIGAMRDEVEVLMATSGYRVEWRQPGHPFIVDNAPIVVVTLQGTCAPPSRETDFPPLKTGAALATTATSGGQILPFSWVDCDALTRLLAHRLEHVPGDPDFTYGRAMGRLLAHELYHIAGNVREHAGSGIAKARFSAADVLANHFRFEASPSGQ